MSFFGRFMLGEGWATIDARGRRVQLFDPFERSGATSSDFSDEEFRRVQFLTRNRSSGWGVLNTLFAVYFGTVLIGGVIAVTTAWDATGIVGILVGAGVIGGALCFLKWGAGGNPARFARAMLSIRRCPSCAYRLDQSGPRTSTPSGVGCPECGAVWKVRPR